MKFGLINTLFSIVSVVVASGPTDGDAIADPNSAVVKLTGKNFKEFVDSNPLVLAEFFAPWCGYCKKLGPEYSSAADALNDSHPNIKLAQIDCTEDEDLCRDYGIRGYPTLKIIKGTENPAEDYEGPRESDGIVDYMIKQSLPAVQVVETVEDLLASIAEQTTPFVIQLADAEEDDDSIFSSVADSLRKDLSFISIKGQELIESLATKYFEFDPTSYLKKVSQIVIHPTDNTIIPFTKDLTKESLTDFIKTEIVPYFGDINRDTYTLYMESPTPLAYYFYNTQEQRDEVESLFNKLGKAHRGTINFVGLDATLFGRHAELLNMDPEIVPLFVIQDNLNNKKFGIDQQANPDGPSAEQIEELVEDFVNGSATPIVKSEPLPTEEEQAESSVFTLVGYNHEDFLKDTTKDILVEYYAHWCGHCKKLAPTWEELGALYKGKSDVLIAKIDHSKNDVETSVQIEGYPTILLYPANGEIDEKTGLRLPISYSGAREFDAFVDFIKTDGGLKVDGNDFKSEEAAEEVADEEIDHDEL